MKNKFLSQKGMSILEMLCVTILILLISAGLASGISLAQRQYTDSMAQSQAVELYTTLETILTNELRYTSEVVLENEKEVKSFYSHTYSIASGKTSLFSVDGVNDYGYLALGVENEYNLLLSPANYPNELGAKVNSFIYDANDNLFKIRLSIGRNGEEIIDGTFDIKPLNELIILK